MSSFLGGSLDIPNIAERVFSENEVNAANNEKIFEPPQSPAATVYSDWSDDEDKDDLSSGTLFSGDLPPLEMPKEESQKDEKAQSKEEEKEEKKKEKKKEDEKEEDDEEDSFAAGQRRKLEALMRRQKASAAYLESSQRKEKNPLQKKSGNAPERRASVKSSVVLKVNDAVVPAKLTPQQERARKLMLRQQRLSSPFMSTGAKKSAPSTPMLTNSTATSTGEMSADEMSDWRHQSDLFLKQLTSTTTSGTATGSSNAVNHNVDDNGEYEEPESASLSGYESPTFARRSAPRKKFGYEAYEEPPLAEDAEDAEDDSYQVPESASVSSSRTSDYDEPFRVSGAYSQDYSEQDDYEEPATAVLKKSNEAHGFGAPKSLALPSHKSSATPRLTRAWNEEFQRLWTRHLSAENGGSAAARDQLNTLLAIGRLAAEFSSKAVELGKIIIAEAFLPEAKKSIKPCNVGGVAGGLKFRSNGIFFKFTVDEHGLFGGNEFASKSALHEFRGLQLYMALAIGGHVSELHFPLMTLVTWHGWRLIATAVLPIDASTIVYGSANQRRTVHCDASVAPLMQKCAALLNIAGHTIESRDKRQSKQLFACGDIEVHRARDNRLYILDTHRIMPPTRPSATRKREFLFRLFRPTFVRRYSLPLCSDAFSGFAAPHERAQFRQQCTLATMHLLDNDIPALVRALEARTTRRGAVGPLSRLTERVHRRGVNLRYLGVMRNHARLPALRRALMTEMVARTIKQLLNVRLRALRESDEVLLYQYSASVADFYKQVFRSSLLPAVDKWWRVEAKRELVARFERAFDSNSDAAEGGDLRALVDERLLYSRLCELTGVSFGAYEAMLHQPEAPDLLPIVHRLYFVPLFEAQLAEQDHSPPLSAPWTEQDEFYARIERLYVECLATRPEETIALDGLGLLYRKWASAAAQAGHGQRALALFEDCFECFEDALEIAPAAHAAVLHFDCGVCLTAKASAVIAARRATLESQQRVRLLRRKIRREQRHMAQQALNDLDHSVPLLQKNIETLNATLTAELERGDVDVLLAVDDNKLSAIFKAAAAHFARAAQLEPSDADALFNRAQCLLMSQIVLIIREEDDDDDDDDEDNEDDEFEPSDANARQADANNRSILTASSSLSASSGSTVGPPSSRRLSLSLPETAADVANLESLLQERRMRVKACVSEARELISRALQLLQVDANERATALEHLCVTLADGAHQQALRMSGRRSPNSQRRREMLKQQTSPAGSGVERSWPPRAEEVESTDLSTHRGGSDSEDEALDMPSRGFRSLLFQSN